MFTITGAAQVIADFEIDLPAKSDELEIPLSTSIKDMQSLPAGSFSLVEVTGNKITPVPFQLIPGGEKMICWLVKPLAGQKKKRYRLIKNSSPLFPAIAAKDEEGTLTITMDGKNLLCYQYATVHPPAGIDTAFRRSGFIHPLWTPHGQVLTRIQPPDHYHHYGIWNPWTHTLFENDSIDFWNIGGKTGTVRFAKILSRNDGPVFSEYSVLHEHIAFKKDGSEKIAINEKQTVRVYQPEENYYIADISSVLTCGTASPILLLTYRYGGGFGFRATELWDRDNCEILTSEGNTRKNTDATKARWCMVQGALPGNDSGGMIILSHPENYNHPEPLRIWDEEANHGRGDVFINFSPTKDRDWLLEPGKTYILKYRIIVFNGKSDAAKAESAWESFAKPPGLKMIKK